jgi:hypothetical protein
MVIKPRPVSTWKIIGVLLVTSFTCALGLWLWIRSVIDHTWAEMERKVYALQGEARSRSGVRPVVRGNPEPERAWKMYDDAIQASYGIRLLGDDETSFVDDEALRAFAPALQMLRRGVQQSDGQRYRDWQHAETRKPVPRLAHLALGEVRRLTKSHQSRAGVELLLDVIQFCGDAGRNGSWEDTVEADRWRGVALTQLKDLILRSSLSGQDLSEVGRELESVEWALPRLRDVLLNSAMDQGFMVLDVARRGTLLKDGDGKASWRFLFSERILIASAFDSELECMRLLAEADEKPWSESYAVQVRAMSQFASINNPILKRYAGWIANGAAPLLWVSRAQRAQIRLLRTVAHYKATGKVLELEDPFGGKLHFEKSGSRLSFWSVGPNGLDDGGVDDGSGDWALPQHREGWPAHLPPGDIVIELRE